MRERCQRAARMRKLQERKVPWYHTKEPVVQATLLPMGDDLVSFLPARLRTRFPRGVDNPDAGA